ncbi:MAG: DUF115 domain-containing protein [Lachnospiraceae bacterium]|nr:DUF115 domain-containing protein [Lachnospiraceae bacterium]
MGLELMKYEETEKRIEKLKEIHSNCLRYISLVRVQKYFVASCRLDEIITALQSLLNDECDESINSILPQLLTAMEAEDYLLTADYLEDGLLVWVENEMISLRRSIEGFDEELFVENYRYNLGRVKECDEDLYRLICDKQSLSMKGNLEITKSGQYTLYFRDELGRYYFHGNGNPQIEGEILAASYFHSNCRHYIVFGLGLGYHCKALADMDDGATYQIFEPDANVLLSAMIADRMDWLWDNDRIELALDPELARFSEALADAGRLSYNSDTALMIHHPSLRHLKIKGIKEKLEEVFVSDASAREQGRLLRSNFRENIKRCNTDLRDVKRDFCGRKAIIAAGGPSLDKNIRLLHDLPEGYVLLCVGTVFRKLMKEGIVPDYVIVTDPMRDIEDQFEGLWNENVPVLILSTACMGVAGKYKGQKYLLFQNDYMDAEMQAKEIGQPLFKCGGSVATTALDLCISFQCSSIAFVGLDLAFSDNLSHASGTAGRQEMSISGWKEVEGYLWKETDGKPIVCDVKVSSSPILTMYRMWIEARLQEKDVTMPVYDASEGGAVIKGTEIIRLTDLLNGKR